MLNVALTHDMWLSLVTEAYGTITCRHIAAHWELRSVVLCTRKAEGTDMGENIAEDLQKVLEEWLLHEKPTPFIVPNNEVKALRILEWLHISCMGHNINLAVRAALALPQVCTVVTRGRNQVTFFHNSPLATSILLKKQEVLPEGTG